MEATTRTGAATRSRERHDSAAGSGKANELLGRLERIDIWSLPFLFIGILGLGFLFTFYDIFDINVSFIQSCVALKKGCTPENAITTLRTPILLNLAGYVLGTLVLSPISDRIGRRNMLLFTMLITGLGALWNALAADYTQFVLARIVTGVGIGADLAIVNTYIGEVAPRRNRAKFTSLIFVMSSIGAFLGVWVGLVLTTEPAPWPKGLSWAQASETFTNGWRWTYAIGALLALVAIALRFELPESPRWLIGRGRLDEAEKVVSGMEERASKRGPLDDPVPVDDPVVTERAPYRELLGSSVYLKRILLLFSMWFLAYVTVYAFSAGGTSIFTALNYEPPEAGLIVAMGVIGFVVAGVTAPFIAEWLERKLWLPLCALITIGGSVLVAEAGDTNLTWAFIGAGIVFFGFNLWVPMAYAWSAENFPTRARTTGFALVDGVGHLGGGVGVLLIAPHLDDWSPLTSLLVISGCLAAAAVIAQFGIRTRDRRLEEVSP
ncbi:MAG TPA: MFS transporter [Thermoleophilaceae bacterium]|jgi:MFS family permease